MPKLRGRFRRFRRAGVRRDEVFEPCKVVSRESDDDEIIHLQRSCHWLGGEAHILCESRHWSSRFEISEIREKVIEAVVQAHDGMHRTVGDQSTQLYPSLRNIAYKDKILLKVEDRHSELGTSRVGVEWGAPEWRCGEAKQWKQHQKT